MGLPFKKFKLCFIDLRLANDIWHIYIQSDYFLKSVLVMIKNFRPRHGIHFFHSKWLLFRLCSCFHSPWSLKQRAPRSSRLRRLSTSNILSQTMMQPPYRSYWRHWDCSDEKSRSALKLDGCFSSFSFINLQHKSCSGLGVVYYSDPIIWNGPKLIISPENWGFVLFTWGWKHGSLPLLFITIFCVTSWLNNAALWLVASLTENQNLFKCSVKKIRSDLSVPALDVYDFLNLEDSGWVIIRLVKHSDLFLWWITWPALRTQRNWKTYWVGMRSLSHMFDEALALSETLWAHYIDCGRMI